MNPSLQEVPRSWLTNSRRIRCGAGDETQQPGMFKFRSVILSKDGNVRRVDCPIRRIPLMPLPVVVIHGIADQCLPECAGSTEHLLLRSGPIKEASARVDTIREVQGKRPQPALNKAKRSSKRGLIRYLDRCFTKHDLLVAWKFGVRRDADFGGTGGFHGFTPMDFMAALGSIETFAGSFHRRVTECSGKLSGNAQLLPAGCSHLLGIEARQDAKFAHGFPPFPMPHCGPYGTECIIADRRRVAHGNIGPGYTLCLPVYCVGQQLYLLQRRHVRFRNQRRCSPALHS